jgi:site-specific recombinase XerD
VVSVTVRLRLSSNHAPPATAVLLDRFEADARAAGFAPKSIREWTLYLRRTAEWLSARRRSLSTLTWDEVPAVVRASASRQWRPSVRTDYRTALHRWLKMTGVIQRPEPDAPWRRWLDQYSEFVSSHRGLSAGRIARHRVVAREFLQWRFGTDEAAWDQVTVRDIWRFSERRRRRQKAATFNSHFGVFRQFLRFVHMRGGCDSNLIHAVPRMANFGQRTQPRTFTDEQRRVVLDSFDLASGDGCRNHAIVRCMVDLGLRPIEVVRLRLGDADFEGRRLHLLPAKNGHGRTLPLVGAVLRALRRYVTKHRPINACERLFVRHKVRRGRPLDTTSMCTTMNLAYRRCGLPPSCSGLYPLRHTFATRLHARGVGLKQIGDLMGHGHLHTTTLYAQVDLVGLRALALPWPV